MSENIKTYKDFCSQIATKYKLGKNLVIGHLPKYYEEAAELYVAYKSEQPIVVYEAMYNPMTEESADCTLSIHRTRKGAEEAISKHKEEIKEQFENGWFDKLSEEDKTEYEKSGISWNRYKDWRIIETKIVE